MAEASDERVGVVAAGVGLVAFAAYTLTAAPTPYLLDSAELAAAGFGLGIAHPPGEALALLWAKLFTLFPLGSVAFRVGLSQAFAGAVAAALAFRFARALIIRLDGAGCLPTRARTLLAATAALAFALAPGVVLSSNRPEVYALAAALALGALAAACSGDAPGALLGAMLLGLGVSNHPMVAGLAGLGAVAAALPLLRRQSGLPRLRMLLLAVGSFLIGLGTLAYLPARAAAHFAGRVPDGILWGDARTWSGFWWVVSGRTFIAKSPIVHGGATPGAFPFVLVHEIGLPLVVLALAGLMYGLRSAAARPLALPLAIALGGSALAAVGAGFDPNNPDVRGYLAVALAATAMLGVAGLAALLIATRRRWIALAGAGLLAAATVVQALPLPARADLHGARAADRTAEEVLESAPIRAAVLTAHFETGFLLAYQRLVEGRRPDAAWVHLGFVRGPGYADRLAAAYPELAPMLSGHRHDQLTLAQLRASSRPVLTEPDAHLQRQLRARLTPAGALWRIGITKPLPSAVLPGPLQPETRAEAARDRQVRGFLGWRAYLDSAVACSQGLTELATRRLHDLHDLLPADERLRGLQTGCEETARRARLGWQRGVGAPPK